MKADARGDGLRWLRLKDENAERKDVELRTRMQNRYSWKYSRAASKWSKWVVEQDVGLLRSRRKMCIRKPVHASYFSPHPFLQSNSFILSTSLKPQSSSLEQAAP